MKGKLLLLLLRAAWQKGPVEHGMLQTTLGRGISFSQAGSLSSSAKGSTAQLSLRPAAGPALLDAAGLGTVPGNRIVVPAQLQSLLLVSPQNNRTAAPATETWGAFRN